MIWEQFLPATLPTPDRFRLRLLILLWRRWFNEQQSPHHWSFASLVHCGLWSMSRVHWNSSVSTSNGAGRLNSRVVELCPAGPTARSCPHHCAAAAASHLQRSSGISSGISIRSSGICLMVFWTPRCVAARLTCHCVVPAAMCHTVTSHCNRSRDAKFRYHATGMLVFLPLPPVVCGIRHEVAGIVPVLVNSVCDLMYIPKCR